MARATTEGLNVSKPWGAYRYDFLVERDGHTWRVQVKSCSYRRNGYYNCIYQAKRRRYTADEFDFVAIYVIPEDVWYVLPVAKVARLGSIIVLSPHLPNSKYDAYKEAWQLLRGNNPLRRRIDLHASASDPHLLSGCGTPADADVTG